MVSVLVPIYNVAPYIERCARSLFSQTYDNCEFIFVDDCSPDNSIKILNNVINDYPEIKDKIRIIHHPQNKGLAAARNTALLHANGNYIIHVDSDDFLDKQAIRKLYDVAISEQSDMVICDFLELKEHSKRVLRNRFYDNKVDYIHSLLTRKSLVNIIGRLIKRSVFTDYNLWEVEGLNQGEDYLMTPRLAYYSNKISMVQEPLYIYNRTNINSYTNNIKDKDVQSIITVQRILNEFFLNLSDAKKYSTIITESSIYNEISLLYCSPLSSYPAICAEYSKVNWKILPLKTKHRAILKLCDYNLYSIVYWMIKMAKKFGQ